MSKKKFETRLIHGDDPSGNPGALPDPTTGVSPPIDLSTTYRRTDPRDDSEYIYSRTNNPTRQRLEARLCGLEDGYAAVAFASGSAASMALFQALPAGSHIIVTEDAYYGTLLQLNNIVANLGHHVTAIDTTRIDEVEHAFQDNTSLVWLETPSNPQMRVSDIRRIAALTAQRGAKLCCDNTLASCVWQRPLQLGADFCMHSSTKFFGGHSDVTGGVLIAREASTLLDQVRYIQQVGGAVPSPFDCWLLLRSLSTLAVRVRHQTRSAEQIARHFSNHPHIEQVLYVGLTDHPGHALNQTQMHAGSALLSLLVKGDASTAIKVAQSTQFFAQATSLGGVESLIEHRYSVEGKTSLCPPNLLRLSVGLEHANDLIEDLEQALATAHV
ncbi:MAG: PLP-dependent aspartate aminotransferase family protein [Pseudomonadota bacterium]